ncbi:MAG: hypothetical protein AUK44_05795 [Porphyromonadaceae bacterium CG2_30_38_12]|nr:MAG: hypothetical protein AUK44_05795 [Porphyromonadaceae bacterium CG2_30_38_12]
MKRKILLFLILGGGLVWANAQITTTGQIASNKKIGGDSRLENTINSTLIANNEVYFRFSSIDQSTYLNQLNDGEAGSHFLGETLAKKTYLFKKRYTHKEPIAPGSSATKLIYRKYDIYFSVKKIEKYLKAELKKGKISTADAAQKYNKVLDVALNVLDEDTEKFQRRILLANGNPSDLLKIFVYEVKLEN